jgi:hypothetical protein
MPFINQKLYGTSERHNDDAYNCLLRTVICVRSPYSAFITKLHSFKGRYDEFL